jgi:predicted amidohydrolase
MKIAAVQLCSGVEIGENLRASEVLIRRAAAGGASLIATPEMTHLLQRDSSQLYAAIAPQDKDKGVQFYARLAAELKIHLLIGSLAVQSASEPASKSAPKRVVNRSFLFGPAGDILAVYDKIHLFDAQVSAAESWKESRVYDRGYKAVTAQAGKAVLGLSICYDLRFAGLYRRYAQCGAHIMTVPAAFTRPTGQAHWETLLRARAIETGSFVLAPAQGGEHADGRETYGHSLIIGPWGEVLAASETDSPAIISAEIDLSQVSQARARIGAWQHAPEFEGP